MGALKVKTGVGTWTTVGVAGAPGPRGPMGPSASGGNFMSSYFGTLRTTDVNTTPILTVPIPVGMTVLLDIEISAGHLGSPNGGGWTRQATYKNVSGTAVLITLSETTTQVSSGDYDDQIVAVGGNVVIAVSSMSGTVDWTAFVTAYQVDTAKQSSWTTLTFDAGSGITNYGGSWPAPRAVKSSAGIVKLVGLGRYTIGNTPDNTLILTLPPGYRPAFRQKFACLAGDNTSAHIFDLDTSGRMTIQTYGPVAGYMSLDNIAFPAADVAPADAWTPIDFTGSDSWVPYNLNDVNWGYPPCYWQDAVGRVWLSGLIKRTSSPPAGDSLMFQLPSRFAPALNGVHALTAGYTQYNLASVSWVGASSANAGQVMFKNTPTDAYRWVSLSNICIIPVAAVPESKWTALTYVAPWKSYSASYAPAGYWIASDGYVHIRGMVSSGANNANITVALPANAQPDHNTMQLTSAINLGSRIDVLGTDANFSIKASAGTSATWTNINGMLIPTTFFG